MCDKNTNGVPFIISAPSGGGKTSICKEIRRIMPEMAYSVSYTTRPKRRGEEEGQDYFFILQKAFRELIDREQFLEWTKVHNHYYGTSRSIVAEKINKGIDCLFDIDINGAVTLKRIFPICVLIFVIPPSLDVLSKRLTGRKTDTDEQIRLRMETARKELNAFKEYNYLVVNDQFQQAVEELKSIIIAERCKKERRRHLVLDILRA